MLVKLRARGAKFAGVAAIAAVIGLAGGGSAQAALKGPSLQAPASSASVQAAPTFTWSAVKGAAQYEFQLSDDQRFNSIVLGTGAGKGSQRTKNTAATLDKSIPDGTYFWRVRAITAKERLGRWSKVRSMTKAWKTAPTLSGPADDYVVSWPSLPLLLRWTPVPHATKYLVSIATDPSLAQLVTPQSKPAEVPGTAFALQGTLPAGRYYWAITPVDAGGLRGTRSRVAAFTWTWPTATATRIVDLNDTPQVFDPQMSWDLVPGAARYEVEVNPDDDFAAGSRVCCSDAVIGTSLSPARILPNNNDVGGSGYNWRVRAFDVDGNPGQWNRGPTFEKAYDNVTPTIPGLHLRDHIGPLAPGTATSAPVFAWEPVPGAAQYQVQWTTYDAPNTNCRWSDVRGVVKTSSVYWTPLSQTNETAVPGSIGIGFNNDDARSGQPYFPEVAISPVGGFGGGSTYCVRVRALSDEAHAENGGSSQVISQWTQVGGSQNQPAFQYVSPPAEAPAPPPRLPDPTYPADAVSGTVSRTPLLRWNPVPGAIRYFVLIARDSNFTNVVDAAFVSMPAYAPNWVLQDEATSYFWAVVPSATDDGSGISGGPRDYNPVPRTFNKLSIPPALTAPVGGVDVSTQPTFRWAPAEAAKHYRLQVSADPQFGDLLDDVTTSSTAYTSSKPYPVDTALYWRVRAEQLQALGGSQVALRWSAVGSFRRRLPAPALSADIARSGELPPVLSWSPVPGALSYDLRIDEADGDVNDFNIKSPAGTFTKFFGIGTFKYRVRANFAAQSGAVASAYSPPQDFTRVISPPGGTRVSLSKTRLTFGWNPASAATSYQVDVSATESFSQVLESVRTNNTSWAPGLGTPYHKQRPLYWRVATVDDGGNVGAYVSAPARKGKPLTVRVTGRLRRNAMSRITIRVRGGGKALKGARVRVSGAGVKSAGKNTGRSGTTSFRLRPTKKGSVSVLVTRSGYANKTVRVSVR